MRKMSAHPSTGNVVRLDQIGPRTGRRLIDLACLMEIGSHSKLRRAVRTALTAARISGCEGVEGGMATW